MIIIVRNESKKYLLIVLSVVGLLVIFYLSTQLVPRIFVTLTKASPATVVSAMDSYILGDRILAKADGIDECKINVFALDKDGKGVAGKQVILEGMEDIEAVNQLTDKDGKASFKLRSKTEGQFTIVAIADGKTIPGGVKLTFRN